ncbi:type III-B CRISPR module RAMP protein Cmr4 [Aerococcaceae bacterium WS4759]|uniref:Type III-B CRISPR module RAMP protein Cmr4 n=1 Tax=Fundicoccus ignavus TaxID=2664442 RepID=A0A6I2GPD2_9LACT|nr:type III-B CRISPR module RAMP protein Cmr4 [Fundicoccus ignavus]MRI86358.1 type III-B CRISPR module RAMP protein Cmr4 [Fundicoccus ignavus]
MKFEKELNFLRCLSPLHAGSGSAIGIVDLPIQRESHTGFPKIESSSLKGAIRSNAYHQKTANSHDTYLKVFGNEAADNDLNQSGCLTVSEARILAFPVKSLNKIFTFITCPMVLNRLLQEQEAFFSQDYRFKFEQVAVKGKALVSDAKILMNGSNIVLEEYVIESEVNSNVVQIATILDKALNLGGYLKERFVVVSDDYFKQFVEYSTDINTRIRIDYDTGVVKDKALFYEENVPAETIFYSFLTYHDSKEASEGVLELQLTSTAVKDYVDQHIDKVFQVGGNSSIGRGLIQRFPIKGGE